MDNLEFWLSLSAWSWEPGVIIIVAAIAGLYAYGFRYYRRQGQLADLIQQGAITPLQPWYFGLGLLALLIALISPIDPLSDQLFSMHMVQHLLLALVAAPLLLLGTPDPFLSPLINLHPAIKPALAKLVAAPMAFIIFTISITAWHIPAFYEATLKNDFVHELEHAMFFWAGVISWWPLLSPHRALPRLSYPGQLLYIFITAIPTAILGAWFVFTERILYPSYAAVPSLWGMSTLDDQQMGGLIMMVPGKLIYLLALTIIFFKWFNHTGQPVAQNQPQT